jgi:hypothetical protein
VCYTFFMRISRTAILFGALALCACTPEAPKSSGLELSLYSGIRQLVNINDTEDRVLERSAWKPEKTDLSQDPGVGRVKFSHVLFFKEIGTRAYFRNGRVALIELQDPFLGNIQGKKLTVFKLEKAAPASWDQVLIAEFGQPNARNGGGSFGSEAFFYGWGDVSFNANGPNEIAIYRDQEIVKFREHSFGRKISIFK